MILKMYANKHAVDVATVVTKGVVKIVTKPSPIVVTGAVIATAVYLNYKHEKGIKCPKYKVFENKSLKDSFLVGIHVSDEQLSGMKNTELYAVSYISTDNGVTFNTAKTYSLVSLLNVYAASEETIEYENGVVVKVSDLANSFLAQLGE